VLNAGPAYVDVSVPAEKYSTVFVEDCREGGGFRAKTTVEALRAIY